MEAMIVPSTQERIWDSQPGIGAVGSGEHADIFAHAPVADGVAGGQSEMYFCSTRCLRRFFNELVDELERRVQVATDKRARTRRGLVAPRSSRA